MNLTISTHTTAIEAHILCGRLESEGVPAFVEYEHHIWANWTISVALGGVRVQVPKAFVEKANQVLINIDEGVFQKALEQEVAFSDPIECPSCHSASTIQLNWSWKFALVSAFIFAIPIPFSRHQMKCEKCFRTWVASDQRGHPLYIQVVTILILWAAMFVIVALWCQWCRLNCEHPEAFRCIIE